MLAIALIADLLIFAAAWAFCVRIKNFSPVDAFWAFAIGLTSAYHLGSESVSGKHAVAAIIIAVWSMRLGLHLARRIIKHHPEEDSRYVKLREAWGEKTNPMFFLLFLGNAVLVFLLALPFHIIASDPDSTFETFSIIGTIVTITGLIGETIADKQMSAFKAADPDPKSVCRKGLWKYSRHPNYFFESVIWTGIFLFAAGSLLLSVGRVNEVINKTGNLFLNHLDDLGTDYARTLSAWHDNFNDRLPEIRKLGFDTPFIRTWNYYLKYCEAGFATRNISVVQAIYTRPNNLNL